jgi:hypothetical protein
MTNGTDTFYNVWCFEPQYNCWIGRINSPGSTPLQCDYQKARALLERWRDPGNEHFYQIREIDDNLEPGFIVGYNVFLAEAMGVQRWTISLGCQDNDGNPRPLTWDEAESIRKMTRKEYKPEVMEIGLDWTACPAHPYKGEVKLAEVDPIEIPKPASVQAPVETTIDFASYNGFKKVPPRMWIAERDPYTGLVKELK